MPNFFQLLFPPSDPIAKSLQESKALRKQAERLQQVADKLYSDYQTVSRDLALTIDELEKKNRQVTMQLEGLQEKQKFHDAYVTPSIVAEAAGILARYEADTAVQVMKKIHEQPRPPE